MIESWTSWQIISAWPSKDWWNRRALKVLDHAIAVSPKNLKRIWKLWKIISKCYEMWIPNQQLKLKMRVKKEKTFRIKTNNQELLIRKQNESDATSWWIEFQKTSLQWKAYRIQDWFLDLLDNLAFLRIRSKIKNPKIKIDF